MAEIGDDMVQLVADGHMSLTQLDSAIQATPGDSLADKMDKKLIILVCQNLKNRNSKKHWHWLRL